MTKPKAKSAAAKPARARSGKDKAGRASPPDRDGDGKSGGSLPGNKTAPEALGTDEHALAVAEIATDGLATIIIKGATTGRGNSHPLGINGKIRHIATNCEVQVDASELAALEASHIEYETVVPLPAAEAAGLDGSLPAAEPSEEAPAEAPAEVEPPVPAEADPALEQTPTPETVTPAEGEPSA